MIEAAQALRRAVKQLLGVEPVIEFDMELDPAEITSSPRWYIVPLRDDGRIVNRRDVQQEVEIALGLAVRIDRQRKNQEALPWVEQLEQLRRQLLAWEEDGWRFATDANPITLALEPEQLERGRFVGGILMRMQREAPWS